MTAPARKPIPGMPEPFHLGYRRSLDGLRGVSILAVIAVHAGLAGTRAGVIGVDIFFVLSGFLITSLLIEEWDKSHSISLRRFYFRRALRLLPALGLLLVAIISFHGLTESGAITLRTAKDAVIALLYSTNWAVALGFRAPAHVFAHTWSLSIEEQFYLLWPLILLLLLRRASSRGSMLRWVILGVFLAAANRALTLLAVAGVSPYRLMYGTDTRADSLLMGCAVAIAMAPELRPSAARARHLIKYAAWLGVVSLAALGSLGLNPGSSYDFDLGVVYFAVSLFAALIIWEVVLSERGLLATLLAQPFLVYIGRISYGLYLWHYPIFCSVAGTGWSHGKQLLVALPLTGAATLASYYLVERPILRYKQRFSA